MHPLVAALVVTLLVTLLSRTLPEQHGATGVGLAFLGAVFVLVLRQDDEVVRQHGLSLGGLLNRTLPPWPALARHAALAVGWALLLALLVFPPFVAGYKLWFAPILRSSFSLNASTIALQEFPGQLLGIALPEEAFFRGYLQSSLDARWPPRWKVAGAWVGPSLLITSAIFAVGHLLTDWNAGRLAVFFPSLMFGWLRARTGGIGAPMVLHASCNVLVMVLARGWGLRG